MSATTYQTIIDAIDTQIAAGVTEPGSMSFPDGRSITYKSLTDLTQARRYYETLLAQVRNAVQPFRLTKIKSGGMN